MTVVTMSSLHSLPTMLLACSFQTGRVTRRVDGSAGQARVRDIGSTQPGEGHASQVGQTCRYQPCVQ